MDPLLLRTAAAFGLAASAGLNTTIPLVLVGLLARFGLLELAAPFDALASDLVLGGLVVLAALEFVGDKVAALDTVVHAVQWPLVATAGAILFASQTGAVRWVSPELALLVGLLAAGAVHGARAAVRPVITGSTVGLGNPVASVLEDGYALALATTSLLAPGLGLALLLVLLATLAAAGLWVAHQGRRLTRWARRRVSGSRHAGVGSTVP